MVIGFVTTPIITRLVSPSDYGQFSIFTMYSNVAFMILYLGMDQSLIRNFYEDSSLKYRKALLLKCCRIPLTAAILSAILVFALDYFGILKFELGSDALALACVYTIIQIIDRFAILIVRLQYKSQLYALLKIIQKLIYVLIALLLIQFTAVDNGISLVVATLVGTAISVAICITSERDLWQLTTAHASDCPITEKELLKYAYPYVFAMGVTTLFQYVDKIFLNAYYSYEEVGIYASTMTLIHVFSVIQTTFNTLWAPMALEHYTNFPEDKKFHQRGNQIITVMMFFIGITLILVKDIFAVLLGEKFREAAYILPFLIFNPIMYTISETTVSGLVFMKKSGLQVVVSLGACITNIIGNSLLVPSLGCQGAAISTGISYIVFYLLRTLLGTHYYKVDFKLGKFGILTLVTCIYALYNTFVKFNVGSIVGFIFCCVVLYVLYRDTFTYGFSYVKKNMFKYLSRN